MGGVIAILEAYSNEESFLSGEELRLTLLRGSIVGGASLFTVNVISAWSCKLWSQRILSGEGYPADGEPFGVQCLEGYCFSTNVLWAVIAFLGAIIGAAAASRRNAKLAIFFVILFACRGVWSSGEIIWALGSASSCQAWSLSKSYWLPIVTLANVVLFTSLGLKFARSVHRPDESRIRFTEELQALNFQVSDAPDCDTPPPFLPLPSAEQRMPAAKTASNSGSPVASLDGRRISSRPRSSLTLGSDGGAAAAASPR